MPGSLRIREGVSKPTGNRRYRISWRGRLVLQVEMAERTGHTSGPDHVWTGSDTRWRDATVYDLDGELKTGENYASR